MTADWNGGVGRLFSWLPPWARPCGLSVNMMQLGLLFVASAALTSGSRGLPAAQKATPRGDGAQRPS